MNKSTLPAGLKDALEPLLEDHQKVKKLFKDFEKAKEPDQKEEIAREVCEELKRHTRLEEEVFYPAVRELGEEDLTELLDEAEVEHATAKDLIEQVDQSGPDDDLFAARVTVLGEYVNHHVQEEEEELFPRLVKHKADLAEAAAEMAEMRPATVR